MDPTLASTLIGGVGNIFSTLQNNAFSMDIAKYQNAFNLEMWNKQNEYNSPKQTMSRLVEAGINPRAYNQIGQFANAGDAPQAASYENKSPLSQFSETARTLYELKSYEAQINKTNEEAKTEDMKRKKMASEIAGMLTREDKKGYQTEQQKIQRQMARMRTMETLERIFEGGHDLDGLLSEFELPEFKGNPSFKGIRNKNQSFLAGIREFEKKFKKYDFEQLMKFGLDNRTSNWIDKLIRMGGRGFSVLGDYIDF